MNDGLLREGLLVNGLFKNKPEFSKLEDKLNSILKNRNIVLSKDITVKKLSNQDNIKNNHTWDCLIQDETYSIGVSIKANNNKTTKHPQYKALIKHIFQNKAAEIIKSFEKHEKRIKTSLLKINPNAKVLADIRKDAENNTISSVDRMLAKRYQSFFFKLFKKGLNKKETKSLLTFAISSKKFLKITWNDNHKFIIEDYMDLEKILNYRIKKVRFNKKNNNIELTFNKSLVLVIRFKISSYKKHLTGSSVKCEINMLSKPKDVISHKI